MSETQQDVMPAAVGPSPMGNGPAHPANLPVPAPASTGSLMGLQSMFMTAQPVGQRRDLTWINSQIRALCAANGNNYLYSWEVNDNRNRRKTVVEGPTIKMANDILRTYGNCFAGVIETVETSDAWEFRAIFIDLETGFNMMRSFRQRRNQSTGLKDAAREEDIIFQIGQSKAIRNVTVNALSSLCEFATEESKKRLLSWVDDNPEKANAYVDKITEQFNIDISRIEAVVGRKRKDWTVPNLAQVIMQLRGVEDGMQNPNDIYPSKADAKEVMAEKTTKDETDTKPGDEPDKKKASDERRQARKKSAEKKTDTKKAEPEPDPTPAESENPAPAETQDAGDNEQPDQEVTEGPAESEVEDPAPEEATDTGEEEEESFEFE